MFEFLRRTFASEFLRHNFVFFVGAVAVGALNYLYYPVLGRMVSPAVFGEIQTLVSLFLQLSAFLSALSVLTVGLVANAQDEREASQTIIDFEKLTVGVGLVVLVLTIIASPLLKAFFQFEATLPFVALALALVISVPFTFRSGFLRGKKKFGRVSAANIVLASSKLLFSVALVALGLGTAGAMFGLVGAQVLAVVYAGYWAFKVGLIGPSLRTYFTHRPSLKRLRPQLKYAAAVMAVSLIITVQYSVDIVLIKHFLDPHEAGLYAGIATVGRILFFLTASIMQVMLPSVKVGNKNNAKLLQKSLLLFAVVCTPILLVCVIAPQFVVQVLMGANYAAYSGLLPLLALAISVVALLNILLNYFVALRQNSVVFVGIAGSALTFWLMITGDHSAFSIVLSLLWGSVAMMCFIAVWVGVTKLRGRQA